MNELLAIKMRPTKLDDIIGQQHLVGPNKVISNLVKNGKIFSMILYGKPGIGKTTLALVMINELKVKYRILNAVINNKKDFDQVVEEAKMYKGLVLVMDEIHRLNKDKQDLLLPFLESGLITLIGMTTANPYHSINPAIRSRCQLYALNELNNNDILTAINKLLTKNILHNLNMTEEVKSMIATMAGYDLRYAYNLIETLYYSTSDGNITVELLKNSGNSNNVFYDKNSDGYYDTISAFQKSIRGSDVNAAIYYLACLIDAGDLDIIFRRLSVIAYEDIGLANSFMGVKVECAIKACERLGLPEARIILANIVIELALSPKSNSAYLAIDMALNDIRSGNIGSVPKHLKNHSNDYIYPHNFPNHYIKQQYLPNSLKDKVYYNPQNNTNEIKNKKIIDNLKQII